MKIAGPTAAALDDLSAKIGDVLQIDADGNPEKVYVEVLEREERGQ